MNGPDLARGWWSEDREVRSAAPITFVVIAAAWFVPPLDRYLVSPPDTARAAAIAWYLIATVACSWRSCSRFAIAGTAVRRRFHS